jgi:hypothetical protein
MKTIKYTAVALALIAAASFSTTAKAAITTQDGDVILGIYDLNAGTDSNTLSYEVDLGQYDSLTKGETFNLGSTISSAFANSGSNLEFNIAGTGGGTGSEQGNGDLNPNDIVLTATSSANLPHLAKTNGTPAGNLETERVDFSQGADVLNGTSSDSSAFEAITIANATIGSFSKQLNDNSGNYGYGGGNTVLTAYSTSASVPLFYIADGGAKTTETAVPSNLGQAQDSFGFSTTGGNVVLTFDPAAAPEPSAYALGLCAAALFWVLNRRRSVA